LNGFNELNSLNPFNSWLYSILWQRGCTFWIVQQFHPGDNSCPEETNATSANIGAVNNKTGKARNAGLPAVMKTTIGAAMRALAGTAECGKVPGVVGVTRAANSTRITDRNVKTGSKTAIGNV